VDVCKVLRRSPITIPYPAYYALQVIEANKFIKKIEEL